MSGEPQRGRDAAYLRSWAGPLRWGEGLALLAGLLCLSLLSAGRSLSRSLQIWSLGHSFIHACIHSFMQAFVHSIIHSCMHSFQPFIPSFTHPTMHSFLLTGYCDSWGQTQQVTLIAIWICKQRDRQSNYFSHAQAAKTVGIQSDLARQKRCTFTRTSAFLLVTSLVCFLACSVADAVVASPATIRPPLSGAAIPVPAG